MTSIETAEVPLVDYLVLGDQPHLVANECTRCGARYFDRRNACASCFAGDFATVAVDTRGEVKAFTIIQFAAPGVTVPYVAAVVDCGGTSVRTNLVDVEPDVDHVVLGMAQARHRRAATGVDVRLALLVNDVDAFGVHRRERGRQQRAMNDVTHDKSFGSKKKSLPPMAPQRPEA